MNSLRVNFDEASQSITDADGAAPQRWDAVCERFDNDVRRIMTVSDREGYTALYACFDENNRPEYYLVEENEKLAKLRHRTFLSKLGKSGR